MARARIFVSSTYYDLKHVRSSLDNFIDSLGYESVLSEKGDIAYSPDMPLDESCYREVGSSDILVLIIGGRYGSEASGAESKLEKDFFDRYESVTKKEFQEAIRREIPTYVLIEHNVYSEYQTYLRNSTNQEISYAHVDSVNIFKFIGEVLALPRNNPTHAFERFSDIEAWLKEQWAGLFRELLRRESEQKKFAELASQVEGLRELNNTLKTYIESVMQQLPKDETAKLIERESERLQEFHRDEMARQNRIVRHLERRFHIPPTCTVESARKSKSVSEFVRLVSEVADESEVENPVAKISSLLNGWSSAFKDLNELRLTLGVSAFKPEERESKVSTGKRPTDH